MLPTHQENETAVMANLLARLKIAKSDDSKAHIINSIFTLCFDDSAMIHPEYQAAASNVTNSLGLGGEVWWEGGREFVHFSTHLVPIK